jgi:hypothetical protein
MKLMCDIFIPFQRCPLLYETKNELFYSTPCLSSKSGTGDKLGIHTIGVINDVTCKFVLRIRRLNFQKNLKNLEKKFCTDNEDLIVTCRKKERKQLFRFFDKNELSLERQNFFDKKKLF